ncbi:MAG: hypothetical protein K2W95_05385 [Candidatus Obscuribacterales bacterium]|nr:hypothetical protein [Candidatus Obscuribacterales bacterium]
MNGAKTEHISCEADLIEAAFTSTPIVSEIEGASPLPRFALLAFAFVAVRLPWIFTVPMQEAPDEYAHYWVIKFLREHWQLPSAAEVHTGGPSAVYGSLPQFGYLPHVLACSFAPVDMIPLLSRFGSLMMGLVLLYAACRTARIVFARKPLLAVALPLAIVLHPQMIFLHSYANCDATSTALSGVLIWLMLETVHSGVTVRRVATMGALAGWLALTKYSALAILPVLALAVVSSCFLHLTPLSVSLPAIALGSILAAGLSGWWFWRNCQEFNGDVLGTKTMYNTWATTFNRELSYSISPWRIIKDLRWWRMMFFSFWGLFGYMNKYIWRPAYLTYVGFLIAAVAGGISAGIAACKRLCASTASARQSLAHAVSGEGSGAQSDACGRNAAKIAVTMWTCLALVAVINLLAMIWASTQNLGGPQGRYLFNSEIPVLALWLTGLYSIPRAGKGLVVSFLIFNALVALGSWIWLFQMYGGFRLTPLPN